ncbi:hypothetical protein B296_00039138 [Ensete ventricosum]|uniref:Uncharacterized protein n=1 Tax=Ensete ventricosum TaxID=4639 RepID=A0A426ZUC9_ENSVE|nr:hypothetical protein B296_00039138 [Ensete ventricosum]
MLGNFNPRSTSAGAPITPVLCLKSTIGLRRYPGFRSAPPVFFCRERRPHGRNSVRNMFPRSGSERFIAGENEMTRMTPNGQGSVADVVASGGHDRSGAHIDWCCLGLTLGTHPDHQHTYDTWTTTRYFIRCLSRVGTERATRSMCFK